MTSVFFSPFFLSVFFLSAFQNQFFNPSPGLTLPGLTLFRSLCIAQLVPPSLAVPAVLSMFILPIFRFPAFSVVLHPQCQPKSALKHQSLCLHSRPNRRSACGVEGSYRQEESTGAAGDPGPHLRSPQPSPEPARGPARVRGGIQAQPHPRRRCSRDHGLILSW